MTLVTPTAFNLPAGLDIGQASRQGLQSKAAGNYVPSTTRPLYAKPERLKSTDGPNFWLFRGTHLHQGVTPGPLGEARCFQPDSGYGRYGNSLGLTLRDVEAASESLATRYGSSDFAIPLSRLSEMETKSIVPTVFRV